MATIWQQLGAFIIDCENVDLSRLKRFHAVGGRWVVPILRGDDSTAPRNLATIDGFRAKCVEAGIKCGIWANGWGEDPDIIVAETAKIAEDHKLGPVMFDLEAPYKAPNEAKLPILLQKARVRMPGRGICVTSFGFLDRQMLWNGRTLSPPKSYYDLKVRFSPQHYTQYDAKYSAVYCMSDLKANGASDFNIKDSTAPGGRGVPLSYVHGCIECQGMDPVNGVAADFAKGLADLTAAKAHGFTYGFQIYTLENMPWSEQIEGDWLRLANERGKLFLV